MKTKEKQKHMIESDARAESDADVRFATHESDAFSARVQELAVMAGSIAALARKCGASESVVRKWRDGNADPSRERCIALARGMDVSLVWVMTGEGPMLASESKPASHSLPVRLDRETLATAGRVLAMAIAGLKVDPATALHLGADVYDHLVLHGLDGERLIEITEVIRKRLQQLGDEK